MSTLPSERQCFEILKEEGCSPKVIRHVCTVNIVAMIIASRIRADRDLVNAGSLLHDVGRSRTHGAKHVSEGVAIARSRDLPEPLVRVISRHIAAGLTKQEAKALGLPDGEYMPETIEEKIVCHADNLVSDDKVTTLQEALDDLNSKGYSNTAMRMKAMHEELSALCGEDIDIMLADAKIAEKVTKKCAVYSVL
ncbi:MAG TPA: HDIG domain-containing protein [Methanomassiliicoccales archaeon]